MSKKLLATITAIVGLFSFLITGCDYSLQCERHIIKKGYIGKVIIYFNQKNGKKEIDKNGCITFDISEQGEYFSSLPLKEGIANSNAFRYFEVINQDSLSEIFEFEKKSYLQDSITNKNKKYVFSISSGFTNPNYTFEYYIDYGVNYNKY